MVFFGGKTWYQTVVSIGCNLNIYGILYINVYNLYGIMYPITFVYLYPIVYGVLLELTFVHHVWIDVQLDIMYSVYFA